jgi:pyruvate ferredoxin oxidoreductase gamma subunit
MIEVRLHGRGGQGAVTSAELLASAAIESGKYAQAFPNFGPERRGAPLMAFFRISEDRIRTRNIIYTPDLVLVLDPSLLRMVDVSSGLKEGGMVICNTKHTCAEIREELGFEHKLATVNANKIAREELGVVITNTTMIGALLKASDLLQLDDLVKPLNKRFGRIAERNVNAMKRAYEETEIN